MTRSKKLLLIATVFLAGLGMFNQSQANADPTTKPALPAGPIPTGVGVVDLDRVAKAMGWNEQMKQHLDSVRESLTDQLRDALQPSKQELSIVRNRIVAEAHLTPAQAANLDGAKSKAALEQLSLTPVQIEEVTRAVSAAYNDEVSAKQRLNAVIEQQRGQVIRMYRDAVQPSIRRVAHANNIAVVFVPGSDVIYFDEAVELSDRVVDDLQHSNLTKIQLPPIPKIDHAAPAPVAPH